MSATDERDPAPGAPDGPVGAAGAGSRVTGDSGRVEGPVAGAPQAAQEAGEPEGALASAQGSQSSGDDSDIGPADQQEEEDREGGGYLAIDAHDVPLEEFRFMFLDLVYNLLSYFYHNDHILTQYYYDYLHQHPRPPNGLWPEPFLPAQGNGDESLADMEPVEPLAQAAVPEPNEAAIPEPPDQAAAREPEEPSHQAAVPEPYEAAAPEPRDQAAAPQEVTGNQHGNSGEEAPKAGGEEEKQAKREKEDGEEQEPQKDLDPAVGSPGKSSGKE